MSEQLEPTITVSLARKINLGNYESADAFVSVSNLRVGATPEEVNEILSVGEMAWPLLEKRIAHEIAEFKASIKGG
jgi:hypothetical protein